MDGSWSVIHLLLYDNWNHSDYRATKKSTIYTSHYRYRADHESGYVADVTYEGEAIPYVAPAKPAYPAAAQAKL